MNEQFISHGWSFSPVTVQSSESKFISRWRTWVSCVHSEKNIYWLQVVWTKANRQILAQTWISFTLNHRRNTRLIDYRQQQFVEPDLGQKRFTSSVFTVLKAFWAAPVFDTVTGAQWRKEKRNTPWTLIPGNISDTHTVHTHNTCRTEQSGSSESDCVYVT